MTDTRISSEPTAWNATKAQDDASAKTTPILRLGRTIKGVWNTVLTWRRNGKAMNELSQCSDWMLADIGIRREQIHQVVHGIGAQHQVPVGNPVKPAIFSGQPGNDQAGRKVA